MGISPFRPQRIFLRRFFSKWVDKNNPLLYMISSYGGCGRSVFVALFTVLHPSIAFFNSGRIGWQNERPATRLAGIQSMGYHARSGQVVLCEDERG
jgi:hypothetical protein